MIKVLFMVQSLDDPSARYRVLQYLPGLEEHAVHGEVEAPRRRRGKRSRIFRLMKSFDVVYVQRKLFQPWESMRIRRKARKLIYDFDDAIMFRDSDRRGFHSWTRKIKFSTLAKKADALVAGNAYLSETAKLFAPDAKTYILPTVVNTKEYPIKEVGQRDLVVIGWLGSRSTIRYLRPMGRILGRIHERYPHTALKVISDGLYKGGRMPVENKGWSSFDEIEDILSLDIGISPLPDDIWTRGKCGLKLIQYQAAGLPVVASRVGVHPEIIKGGENGFLASTDDEWIEALSRLIEDRELRRKMGRKGRDVVRQKYSLETGLQKLSDILRNICNE